LKQLIGMLEKDNDRRQVLFDTANPQYEFVALRAEHILPDGNVLVAYSRGANGLDQPYANQHWQETSPIPASRHFPLVIIVKLLQI
jgi:hypothetical protein